VEFRADQTKKFAAGFGISEFTGECGRGGDAVLLLHATHHHAHMLGFDHHSNALRLEGILYDVAHFDGKTLLHLKSARVNIYNARNFAQPHDISVGDVSDMGFSKKRQKPNY